MTIDTAVILAGGLGTRLRDLGLGVPKSLVPVAGKPLLEYQLESLRRGGIVRVILVTGHLGEQIRDHCADGSRFGLRIEYFHETEPLGTAGCFGALRDTLPAQFFVLYGDVLLDVDFHRFAEFHRGHPGRWSLLVHPNDHPADSDLIQLDADGVVTDIIPKNVARIGWYHNLVNAGVFALDRESVGSVRVGGFHDLERDVLALAIPRRQVYGYRSTEYVKDVGTPRRLELVARHVASGMVSARCLRRRQRAVFLDRDGTLNTYVGRVTEPDQLAVTEDAYAALAALNDSDYLAIVVTNQPVVARGECSPHDLEQIHRKLETTLGARSVFVDGLYHCPHHPDRGYPGENPLYKVDCTCRKPAIGLVEKAARAYHIDLSASWFIGDTTVDVQTGRNAGTRTILLRAGVGGADAKYPATADFVAGDLKEAIKIALDGGV